MTTETAALVRQMREALDAVAPHTDKLICYVSTAAEHPENLIDGQVQAAIASADQWLAQQRGPLTDEQNSADAARWREMRRVFRVAEHIGATTGMPATKLSCHWYGWASGNHADVTGCVDALISERAHGIGQPAGEDKR